MGPERAAFGLRRHASGCAPRNCGLMKLLSRWAGSTRAARADLVFRARRTWRSIRRSSSGAHAVVVGQKAVTPYRGRRAAIPVGVSTSAVACQPYACRGTAPGCWRCEQRRRGGSSWVVGREPRSTAPSITSTPGDSIRSGSTTLAPDRMIIEELRQRGRRQAPRRRHRVPPARWTRHRSLPAAAAGPARDAPGRAAGLGLTP